MQGIKESIHKLLWLRYRKEERQASFDKFPVGDQQRVQRQHRLGSKPGDNFWNNHYPLQFLAEEVPIHPVQKTWIPFIRFKSGLAFGDLRTNSRETSLQEKQLNVCSSI